VENAEEILMDIESPDGSVEDEVASGEAGSSPLPPELQSALDTAIDEGRIELPALPAVANELLSATFDDECDLQKAEKILEKDPHLAGQVLRTANSALFAPPVPIQSVRRALAHLGLGRIRNVAMSVACESQVFVTEGFRAEADALLHHSKEVARLSHVAAKHLRVADDEAAIVGLLHDVGRVVLLQAIEQVRVVLRLKKKLKFDVSPEAALAATTARHAEVGAAVMKKWDLPQGLVTAIEHHHESASMEEGPLRRLVTVVRLADQVANGDLEGATRTAGELGAADGLVEELSTAEAESDG